MERVCYDADISVRNWKVVDFLNRAFRKAYYFLGGDFDRRLASTRASLDSGSLCVFASAHHDTYRDLYVWDVPIRQTDDHLDLTLYPQTPLPKEKIENTIQTFRSTYPSYERVAELFDIELKFRSGQSLDEPEELLTRGIELSSADFNLIFDKFCEMFGTTLTDHDLQNSNKYLSAFQAILDFVHDIYQIGDDITTNEFNPLLAADARNIDQGVITEFIYNKFNIMESAISSVQDNNHRLFLQRTIDYWKPKYENEIRPIISEFYAEEDFHRSVAIVTQI
jgi:hypothetical protein